MPTSLTEFIQNGYALAAHRNQNATRKPARVARQPRPAQRIYSTRLLTFCHAMC